MHVCKEQDFWACDDFQVAGFEGIGNLSGVNVGSFFFPYAAATLLPPHTLPTLCGFVSLAQLGEMGSVDLYLSTLSGIWGPFFIILVLTSNMGLHWDGHILDAIYLWLLLWNWKDQCVCCLLDFVKKLMIFLLRFPKFW